MNRDSGGLFGAIPITNAESALDKSIQQGTTDAKATSQLSSADSNSVIAAIQNLTPDIQTSLQAVQSKKAQFAAAGLTSTVQNDLASLKSDTDSFANALIAVSVSFETSNCFSWAELTLLSRSPQLIPRIKPTQRRRPSTATSKPRSTPQLKEFLGIRG